MSKKEILLIAPSFAPYRAIRATSLARYLAEKNYSVTVMRTLFTDTDTYLRTVQEPTELHYVSVHVEKERAFTTMESKYCETVQELTSKKHFDVAIITLGPFYTYACAELLKERNIPLILDFRDLCVCEGFRTVNPFYLAGRFKCWKLMQKRETAALRCASRIVTVVDDDRKRLANWYKWLDIEDKISTIFNGYDERRYKKHAKNKNTITEIGNKKSFNIGVFGKLAYYDKKLAFDLFRSIRRINERKICIVHAGEREDIEPILKISGVKAEQYIYRGELDYKEGMDLMAQMDALCIVSCTTKGALGTKLFDYIYLNKPIIVMENRSTAITNLIKSNGFTSGGFVCRNCKTAEAAIRSIIQNNITCLTTQSKCACFSRDVQNAKYCELIDDIIKR